jgi:hypothetical protein
MPPIAQKKVRPERKNSAPLDSRIWALPGEDLSHVGERLELEGVAEGVEEEHRRLLADLAREADVGLDHEARSCVQQASCQALPIRHRQDRAEVAHRYGPTIDLAGSALVTLRWSQVGHDLVTIEIEVDPRWRALPFKAFQQVTVEASSIGQIRDGKGEMEESLGDHVVSGWTVRPRSRGVGEATCDACRWAACSSSARCITCLPVS